MIEIKTQQQRNAVQATYEFSKEHATLVDSSDGQFSGNFCHETYERNGKQTIYYFEGAKLFAYEDVE